MLPSSWATTSPSSAISKSNKGILMLVQSSFPVPQHVRLLESENRTAVLLAGTMIAHFRATFKWENSKQEKFGESTNLFAKCWKFDGLRDKFCQGLPNTNAIFKSNLVGAVKPASQNDR